MPFSCPVLAHQFELFEFRMFVVSHVGLYRTIVAKMMIMLVFYDPNVVALISLGTGVIVACSLMILF